MNVADILDDDLSERAGLLRRKGIALECAASTLNGISQRVEAGQADVGDFTLAVGDYELARDDFRESLAGSSGHSAAWIERVLAL